MQKQYTVEELRKLVAAVEESEALWAAVAIEYDYGPDVYCHATRARQHWQRRLAKAEGAAKEDGNA